MTEAEIQNLLDGWIQARRKVWDALFGLATANAPAPWQEFLERSVGSYEQMVESLLKAQAAGVSTALRAFGPLNAWVAGMQRMTETMVETQRKSAEAWSEATAEMTSPMMPLSPLVDASGAAIATAAPSSRGATTGVAKEASAAGKTGQRPTTAAA